MEKLLKMKIFKEDMHVQGYCQWPTEVEIQTIVNFLSL